MNAINSVRTCLVTMVLLLCLGSVGLGADELPVYDIPRMDGITVDGRADDWADKGFQINMLADGKGEVRRQDDFAPRFRLGWNDEGLLVLATVRDDKADPNSNEPGAEKDSVQVILAKGQGSPDPIRAIMIPARDERQPGPRIGLNDLGKSGTILARDQSERLSNLKIEAAETHTKGGYTIEAMVPWSNLGVKPAEGLQMAANVTATDSDSDALYGRSFGVSWHPCAEVIYRGDRTALHRIRLARSASPPQDLAVRIACPGRMLSVNVTAAKNLVGKEVALKRGPSIIAKARLKGQPSCSSASIAAPISAFEGAIVATVEVEGGPSACAILEGPDAPGCLANYILSSDDCQTWDMARLRAAAQVLTGESHQEAAARSRLIECLDKECFGNATRLCHGRISGMDVLSNLLPDLGAKRVEQWVAAIRQALEMKEPVDVDNVLPLIQALAILTESDAGQCAADWLSRHGQSLDDEYLVELGGRSRGFGPQGAAIQSAIAKRVESFILAHEKTTATDISRVHSALDCIHEVLSPQQKEAISRNVAQMWPPGSEQHIQDLDAWPFHRILDTYGLLEDGNSVAWLLESQTCKRFPLSDQATFVLPASRIQGLKEAANLRARVEAALPTLLVEKRFTEITRIVSDLSPLPAELKARSSQAIRKAFLPDDKAVGALADDDLIEAARCMVRLEDAEGLSLLLKDDRIARRFSPQQMTTLTGFLTGSDKGPSLESIIWDQFEKAYLSGDRLEESDVTAVMAMGRRLAARLPQGRKAAWLDLLRSKVVKDGVFSAGLGAENIASVAGLLTFLGDPDAPAMAGAWLEKNWSSASLGTATGLFSSTQLLAKGPEKAHLAQHVQRCLMDDDKMSFVALRRAAQAAGMVADFLEADKKPPLAESLMKRYAPYKESIAAMRFGELDSMFVAVVRLGDANAAASLVENNNTWKQAKTLPLASLYSSSLRLSKDGLPLPLSQAIYEQFEKQYFLHPPGPKDMAGFATAMEVISKQLPAGRLESLARKLEEVYADKAMLSSLDSLQAYSTIRAAVALKGFEVVRNILRGDANWPNLTLPQIALLAGNLANLGETGAALQQLLVSRADTALSTVKSTTQLRDAVRLVNALADAMTPERRQALAAMLVDRLAKDASTSAALSDAQYIDLASVLARLDPGSVLGGLLSQERLDRLDLVNLGRLMAALMPLKDKGSPIRLALVEYVEKTWITGGRLRPADLPQLGDLLRRFSQEIPAERRRPWAEALRGSMVSDAALVSMTPDSYVSLDDSMRRLGEANTADMFSRWFEKSSNWRFEDLSRLLTMLANRPVLGKENDSAALRAISDHLLKDCLSDANSTRRITPWAWRAAVLRLDKFFSEDQRHLAGERLLSAFVGDMDAFGGLKTPDALVQCWQALGRWDLATLLSEAQRHSGGNPYRLRDASCAQTVCGLVLSQVAAAQPGQRQAVWDIGRPYIADRIDEFSQRTFEILDGFVEAMESDPVLAEAIIRDVAKRTRDVHGTLPRLEQTLVGFTLQRQMQDAPDEVQKAFRQARRLQSRGDLAGATTAFRAIVDSKDCPARVRDALHRRIVAMLLEQKTDLDAIDKYLPALRRQGQDLDPEAWNLSCRALLRRVAATKDNRAEVWKEGIGGLVAATIVVHEKTLEDLDKLTEFLAQDDGELASAIVTDLLLAVPDRHSMRRLQWRRIAMLNKARDWDSAQAAAAMDVAQAAAGGQGVDPAVERYMEILRSSGAARAKVDEAVSNLLCGAAGDSAPARTAVRLVDEPLRRAAQEAMAIPSQADGTRRMAYLTLLAGKKDNVLSCGRDRLARCTDIQEVSDALADIYMILAVSGGDLSVANRFVECLRRPADSVSGERLDIGDDALLTMLAGVNSPDKRKPAADSERQPFVDWPTEEKAAVVRDYCARWAAEMKPLAGLAMGRGNKALAFRLYAMTLRNKRAPEEIATALDSIVESQKPQMKFADIRAALKEISDLVPRMPHRRLALVKVAGLAHEEKFFDECLSILDEADALDAKAKEGDFAASILRASAMLEMEDYDGADKILSEAAKWDGTDENKAQCLFVTACLRLKQGQTKDAREILQNLIARYPGASVVAKARQLVARVK